MSFSQFFCIFDFWEVFPSAWASLVASIPGLGRSPGEGKGYPLKYSGLENAMDCVVNGVAKSQIQLSDFHFHFPSA